MNNIRTIALLLLLLTAVILAVLWVPFCQIYAVNTLFKTDIEYSWWNWACALFLTMSVRSVNYKGNIIGEKSN